jgi:flagellar motility protein MotE (MotC chaperone)
MSASTLRCELRGLLLVAGALALASGCAREAPAAPAAEPAAAPAAGDAAEADAAPTGEAGEDAPPEDPPSAAEGFEDPAAEGTATTPPAERDALAQVDGELAARRRALEERALSFATAQGELDDASKALDGKLTGIAKLETRLEELLGVGEQAQARREERIGSLAGLVSAMPPQAGAEIVAQLTDVDAQALLLAIQRKNERKAAKLMAQMPAERAAQLGQLFIDRDPQAIEPPRPREGAAAPATPPTAEPSKADPPAPAPTKPAEGGE